MTPAQPVFEAALGIMLNDHAGARPDWMAALTRDPALAVKVLARNVVLVRICQHLSTAGVASPELQAAAQAEQVRIDKAVQLISRLGELCQRAGVEFLFTKAFQHFPDMGHDVDLFVWDATARVDTALIRELGAAPSQSNSWLNRVAGKSPYDLPEFGSPVEVHHRRLGQMGEHKVLAGLVHRGRRLETVAGIQTYAPAPSDQMILQALQRVFSHLHMRVSDLVQTVQLAGSGQVDWDYVFRTTRQVGIFPGFSGYLLAVESICQRVTERRFLPGDVRRQLKARRWHEPSFQGATYRFPALATLAAAYGGKLQRDLMTGAWDGVWRVCVIPPLALLSIGGRRILRSLVVDQT